MSEYKMPRKASERGPSGKAKVQVKGDKVRVTLLIEKKDEKPEEIIAVLDKKNCPETVKPGQWFVTLSANHEKMYAIRPINGMFTFHTHHFWAKENQQPVFRTKKSQYGDYQVFSVVLEILDPAEANGMFVPYEMPYNFVEAVEEVKGEKRKVAAIGHLKSKYTQKLIDYLDAAKIEKHGPIPWGDNLCPLLEKRALRENASFKGIMKNGYLDTIYQESALPEDDLGEDEEDNIPF